jgi:uncharacterized protein DUF3300
MKLKENYMLPHARLLMSLKYVALVLMVSVTVFMSGAYLPVNHVMAEEQKSDAATTSTDEASLLSSNELVELVGPIALYPDELLAITLPAATYPLEIVQAARYLEKHKKNPELKPDEKWDESVLGLLNYPEVIELMNNDLDWTWKLGAAVVDQQGDVMDAIQTFRTMANTAGNLESNDNQVIVVEKEIIKIESATPEVIYVPTYTPSTVVVHQTVPYPYYYSPPYPYYYHPAAVFWTGVFIGAAVRYGVGWGRYGRGDTNITVNRGGNTINIGSGNIGSGNRPGAGNRPGVGTRPGAGSRPGIGNRPSTGQRPGAGPGTGQRPSTGKKPSTRPSTGQRPSAGTKPSTRPSTGQRPSAGTKPSIRPTTKPSTRPTTKPSTSQRLSSNRTRTGNSGSFGGYNRGSSTTKYSQRGISSRASQSSSRMSRSSSGRYGGGGRSLGGARRR